MMSPSFPYIYLDFFKKQFHAYSGTSSYACLGMIQYATRIPTITSFLRLLRSGSL